MGIQVFIQTSAGRSPLGPAGTSPGDTRLALAAWPGVPARLTGHRSGALDGLEFSVAGNPGIEVELLPGAGIPVPLPARLGDGQDGGEEKGYRALASAFCIR